MAVGDARGEAPVEYPVVFSLQKHVAGNGFLAEVNVSCWSLLSFDNNDKEWWAFGVRPDGFAASGASWNEAYLNFRIELIRVLIDSAVLTDGFDAFKADVETVMGQTHEEALRRWTEARQRVREGHPIEDATLAELPRVAKAVEPSIVVRRLDTGTHLFVPSENRAPEAPQLMDAA